MFFFFKQKTAYEMRISDWSSDVCSSDLVIGRFGIVSTSHHPRDQRECEQELQKLGGHVVPAFLVVCEVVSEVVERVRARSSRALTGDMPRIGFAATGWERSDERREGKECGRTCSSRGLRYH